METFLFSLKKIQKEGEFMYYDLDYTSYEEMMDDDYYLYMKKEEEEEYENNYLYDEDE